MIKPISIREGEKYTIYGLSGMATTARREVIITDVLDSPEYRKAYVSDQPSVHGTWRIGAYREHRKRKQYHLDFKTDQTLVIPSWDHLLTDADAYHAFCGNACLNLAGSIADVKELVAKNINPHFSNYDILLAYPAPHTELPDHDGLMVYPEYPTTHAVILRTRDNLVARNKLSEQKGSITCA
jgi:hypothetical protein